MQKVEFNKGEVDLENLPIALQTSNENSEMAAVPVCESVEDFENLRFSLYTPVAADFFIKNAYGFLSEQTGCDLKTVDKYVSAGFSSQEHYFSGREKNLYLQSALEPLATKNHDGIFTTQVELAKSQGVDRNKYVFLQKYDERVGEEGYDIKGFPYAYTRFGGRWYWHPDNTGYVCAGILADDIITNLANTLGVSRDEFVDGVYAAMNPQVKTVVESSEPLAKEYSSTKRKIAQFEKTNREKTCGDLFLPALGEYLVKFKEQFPEVEANYNEALTSLLNRRDSKGLTIEDCFAIFDENQILALTSGLKTAKKIKDEYGLKDAQVADIISAIKKLKQMKSEKAVAEAGGYGNE